MADEPPDFETDASEYGSAVERVLTERRRRPLDPHLRELLQSTVTTLDEARFAARTSTRPDAPAVVDGLCRTLAGSRPEQLDRDTAAELLQCLKRGAIRLGDDTYLHTLVTSELILLGQDDAAIWKAVLKDERLPPPVLEDAALKDGDHARAWLLSVLQVRGEWQRRRWVRLRLKNKLLTRLAVGLAILVVATAAAADLAGAELKAILLVVATGALGAAVSGIYKLRDEVAAAIAIRAFGPTAAAQVAVGAAAGLFAFFLVETGVLDLGGDVRWATRGAAAFVAGFSEPFLLGAVRRVAGAG